QIGFVEDAAIVVRGGVIESVGPAAGTTEFPAAERIDARGQLAGGRFDAQPAQPLGQFAHRARSRAHQRVPWSPWSRGRISSSASRCRSGWLSRTASWVR
ncbi:hypothetical protein FNH08_41210, partial [Streptomyces spongiae]|nr:hypothetical protein [Streptomyces spongiae]